MQDRPEEMPQNPPRPDGFSESRPWEIAEAFRPAEGMRFLALEIVALNAGGKTWRFNPSKLALLDINGQSYDVKLGRAAQGLRPFDLQSGQKARGWVVFELPEAALPFKVNYTLDAGRMLEAGLEAASNWPDVRPETVTVTEASASNLTMSLLAVKDPGVPFSTFSYTYIAGCRPVNIGIEIRNKSQEALAFRPHQFTLMDDSGVLYFEQPGGASHALDGEDLQPGEVRQGEVSFDLPEGAAPAQLMYSITPNTGQILHIAIQP